MFFSNILAIFDDFFLSGGLQRCCRTSKKLLNMAKIFKKEKKKSWLKFGLIHFLSLFHRSITICYYYLFTYLLTVMPVMRQFDGGGTSDMHKIAVLFSMLTTTMKKCIFTNGSIFYFLKYFVKLHVAGRKLQRIQCCATYTKKSVSNKT